MVPSFLQSSLLKDAVQGAWGEIVARFLGNRDASRLGVVLELTVAAPRCDETPTVVLQHPQYFADLHPVSISGLPPVPVRHNDSALSGRRWRVRWAVKRSCRAARVMEWTPPATCTASTCQSRLASTGACGGRSQHV